MREGKSGKAPEDFAILTDGNESRYRLKYEIERLKTQSYKYTNCHHQRAYSIS